MEFKKPQQVGRADLVNDALCNDCDLEAEDTKVIASEQASVKSKVCVCLSVSVCGGKRGVSVGHQAGACYGALPHLLNRMRL
eukprot:357160-Chlamydomonas_euryale.AAC.2